MKIETTPTYWAHMRERWDIYRTFGYEGERWCAFFHAIAWDCISLGFHFCWSKPNIEIHLPFGFIKIGRQ